MYAHHLSRCPSYALSNNVISGRFRKNDLFRLKTKFAAEVRRNLFEAYLRPRETHINLISVSANSSAAFPGGESFRFEFSPNGRTILAISSSRIYILDASADTIEIRRELRTVRRPLSASVTDDGSLLAVLSSKYQANIYLLTPGNPVKHVQVIVLDNPPRTIALSHEGTVLAAAWKGGIEVFSLAANALSTDRRAVRSEVVDSLAFSGEGSMIIGSSHDLDEPNAVVITAPFYTENDPNITPREIHSRMWTTQILFPQISSTVSHVALLPGHTEGDTNWLFAYDHTLMTYRAVRTDDTRTGVAYFLSPAAERFEFPQPSIAPVSTSCGTLAAAGFADHGLWLYGIPERLDVSPDMGAVLERNEERMQGRVALTTATGHVEPLMAYSPSISGSSQMIDMEEEGLAGKVDWRQSLFVKCKTVRGINGFASAKWVEDSPEYPCGFNGKRLIVTAPAGVSNLGDDLGEENMPVDGSRLCLLDFDYGPSTKQNREFTIEVGDNEAELLTEQMGNMEIEVAMERRRTVRAAKGRGNPASHRISLGRSVTAASPPVPSVSEELLRRQAVYPPSPSEVTSPSRSQANGLTRAQTAAGFQQARFPPRPPLGTGSSSGEVPNNRPIHEYYGPDRGHGLAHRNSVGSWQTPPPPYNPNEQQPGINHRSHISSPNLRARSSSHGSNQEAIDGNLRTLGVFTNRTQEPVSAPTSAVPRQVYTRQSTTLDGMMTSENGPSSHMMSQYGALARSPRPDDIPEEVQNQAGSVSDVSLPRHQPHLSQQFHNNSPTHRRPVSQSATPHIDYGPLSLQIAPSSPDRQPQHKENRLSLTGNNLQNRLNHPVPPTPDHSSTYSPAQAQQQYLSYSQPQNPPSPEFRNNRHSYIPTNLQPGRPTSREIRINPSHDPWSAEIPTSPTFNRSRPASGSSFIGVATASQSTPNLLHTSSFPQAQSPLGQSPLGQGRQNASRMETVQSVEREPHPGNVERAHSAADIYQRQISYYTNAAIAEEAAEKKKKDKKGRRCVVM